MASSVGPMTKRERNSASPTSTWFGGTLCVPMALRANDNTTTIFVNAVHIRRIAGATPSTVISTMIVRTWLGLPGTDTVTSLPPAAVVPGAVGAVGPVGFCTAGAPRDAAPTDAMALTGMGWAAAGAEPPMS